MSGHSRGAGADNFNIHFKGSPFFSSSTYTGLEPLSETRCNKRR